MISLEDWVKLNEDKIMHGYIDRILEGDEMETEKVLEIKEDVPGAAPVPELALADVYKYGGLLEKIIPLLLSGEGEFDFKFHGINKHIAITNL